MTGLKDRLQHAFDEARILVLVAQVMVGFEFQAPMQPGFARLPRLAQLGKMGALALLLVTLALVVAPAAHQPLVEGARATSRMHRFATRVLGAALLPFAAGLGLEVYVAAARVLPPRGGALAGLAAFALAIGAWYVPGALRVRGRRRARAREERDTAMETEPARPSAGDADLSLVERVKQAFIEVRVVLPGAQALLGFQFAAVLQDGFDALPPVAKAVHLGSLGLVALATVLLMTPAAYHRLGEQGEDDEHLVRVASRMLVAALAPLALGIAGEFYVVFGRVTGSPRAGLVGGGAVTALFVGCWFVWPALRRARAARRGAGPAATA